MSKEKKFESYSRNFLNQVACEIRFPSLLILNEIIPLFQKEIRNKFSNLEVGFLVKFPSDLKDQIIKGPPEFNEWTFVSENNLDRIKIAINRIAIITTTYNSYKDFKSKFSKIFEIFFKLSEIDEFSRVGLRFTNTVPISKDNYIQEITNQFNTIVNQSLITDKEPYTFRTEFRWQNSKDEKTTIWTQFSKEKSENPKYILDIDSYIEQRGSIRDIDKKIDSLHSNLVSEFENSITDNFRERLRN